MSEPLSEGTPLELLQVVDEAETKAEENPDDAELAYQDAQRSIADARRSAEMHEGLLQIS